jgi:hypothetical protein
VPADVYRDPNEDNRMWVVFDWDEQGWADTRAARVGPSWSPARRRVEYPEIFAKRLVA